MRQNGHATFLTSVSIQKGYSLRTSCGCPYSSWNRMARKPTNPRQRRQEGINESSTRSEDCVGLGRIALFGVSLSHDDFCAARPLHVDDVQPVCHPRRFLASGNPQPTSESQPDRFYSLVELRS